MRRPVERLACRLVLLALLVVGAASVLALAPRLQATKTARVGHHEPSPVADHWPPFRMTYQATEFDPETQAVKYTAPYRVEWTDRRHWRNTRSGPAVPRPGRALTPALSQGEREIGKAIAGFGISRSSTRPAIS